ncbi:transcription initiation factor TFIIH subunit 2 [Fistulifera solaris]|uniref:General transcription factor IIH subunit n=1 Tax=Fistulifera solaris TaxID=1519565 RepID=A0A1Z5JAY7_FISSO|nr:transcription initiation factor TFIIH subunit 2 [Fistulifera solaris]|eukprot:GAX11145.1 transcription initiation factor TFIIH subunit 2 [Fistulifera solaris]
MSAPASTINETGATTHTWEDTGGGNLWETTVQEDAEGRIVVAHGDTLAQTIRKRRKRLEQNDHSQRNRRVVRDMIRYVYVLIDASRWTRQKDPVLPPGTRLHCILQILQQFIRQYYDQNPLSHLGFIYVKNGEAEILSPLSSNSKAHSLALQSLAQVASTQTPHQAGEFSLQNGLEVAGRSLGHQPRHGSREVVVLTAALSTCDPGYILTDTLPKLKQAHIRVSSFALSAELHICRKLAEETGGTMGVCLDKAHFREWMQGQSVPPPTLKDQVRELSCEMIRMGFPVRVSSEMAESVHATREKTILARTAYICPQCQSKNAELPVDCAVCGLKLVLASHLARSFHHLFPVATFIESPLPSTTNDDVPMTGIPSASVAVSSSSVALKMDYLSQLDGKLLISAKDDERCCFACLRPFHATAAEIISPTLQQDGEALRMQCPDCQNYFCIDCDAFLHETLHNCPGCLRK